MPKENSADEQPLNSTFDPRREYMSGGTLFGQYSNTSSSTLSTTADEVMNELGIEIYDKMSQDPEVAKCINVLKISVLGNGLKLLPSVSDVHPEYNTALQVSNFCEEALKKLDKPVRDTLEQMLDAMIYGHKIAEITYDLDEIKGYDGLFLIPKKIKPKKVGSVRFIVDKSLNIIGFAGTDSIAYTVEPVTNNKALIYDKDNKIVIKINGKEFTFVDRDKFLVLTVRQKDDDPRGRSLLRPAFNAWNFKQQIYPEYLRYLLVCAIPLIVGFTPDSEQGIPRILKDANGNPVKDSNGRIIEVDPIVAMRDALLQARDSSVLALRGGSKVQEVGVQGTASAGSPFYKAMEIFDEQISKAILLQTLATSEGRYQSRAASQTHQSMLDQLIWYLKGIVLDMIERDLIAKIIKYNLGEEYLKYKPILSLGDTERRDFSIDAQAVASLFGAGYLSDDQKRYTDEMLGLPVRDANYDKFRDLSPLEALQLAKTKLEVEALQNQIKTSKEQTNLLRMQQLAQLKATVGDEPLPLNADALTTAITTIFNEFISENIDDNKTENEIIEKLIEAVKSIKQTETGDVGNIPAIEGGSPVDPSLPEQPPISGSKVKSPYTSVKNNPTKLH